MGRACVQVILLAALLAATHAVRTPKPIVTFPTPTPTTSSPPPLPAVPAATPPACPADDVLSPVSRLRSALKNPLYTQMKFPDGILDAFLVFYSDEHLSEEPGPEERRLEYVSGWDGPGTGVVVGEGLSALWVPATELERARAAVSPCAWAVFDGDDPNQPSITEWIMGRLERKGRVGGDARLTSANEWATLHDTMANVGLQLFHSPTLLDQLWRDEPNLDRRQPEFNRIVANLFAPAYTGLSWTEKVALVRKELRINGADAMVVTALDEVAWLLNVRGRDLPHAPLLKAFAVVTQVDVKLYVPPGKLSMPLREALSSYGCTRTTNCTHVLEYSTIYGDLRRATEFQRILIPTAGTFQRGASAAIATAVPGNRRLLLPSPIVYLKAQKNKAEIEGMKKAHLRDAVAMCTLLNYLEDMASSGQTELSMGLKVDITRASQAGYVGRSMATRVAFGPSGAVPDYRATNATNRRVLKNNTVVIQSGGQYEEGTTIVTRTLHFGKPTRELRLAYTTVLRSLAAMSALRTPGTLLAGHTDPVARAPLWAQRQDYLHPTGHGVGAALNRREDPVVIDYRQDMNLHTFREGYFITTEPAWYDAKRRFGVRLGNVLQVVAESEGYLGFRQTTLVPFEPKLIDKSLLTKYEMDWLNKYNEEIRNIVGPELKNQGLLDVYYWMSNKTQLYSPEVQCKSSASYIQASLLFLDIFLMFLM